MSETLPEVDEFSANVVVPNGDDWMDNAAEVVAALTQKLVNRTYYLNLRAGKLAAAQAWADVNTFLKTIVAQAATIAAPALSLRRATGSASYWQLLAEFHVDQAGTPQRVGLYTVPHGTTIGGFAIVFNAVYAVSPGWQLIDTNQAASALIFRYGDVRYVSKPAHSAAFAAWPQTAVDGYGGVFASELVQADTVLTARAVATANTNADHADNGFRWGDQARTSPIPLGSLYGNTQQTVLGAVGRNTSITGAADQVWIPIRIPLYCSFGEVRVQFYQFQGIASDQFQLYKRSGLGGWSAQGSFENMSSIGDPDSLITIHLHTGGSQIMLEGDEWAYRWKVVSGDVAANDNRIVGVELDWTDIGPSNRVG